jgi:putative tryptophan/tyrosine transport system substrate-binding protein
MKRRDFIAVIAGFASTWPLVASAQEGGRTYRLGFLLPVSRTAPAIMAFFDELRTNGFVEGQNLAVISGGFEVRNEQVSQAVANLVAGKPDVILSGGDFSTRALEQASKTIPIIVITEDVVAAGFAASLAQPGGNVTGVSLMSTDLDGKRQDILIEAVPQAQRIAVLVDSNVATLQHLKALEDSAKGHGKELLIIRVANRTDLEPAIKNASAQGAHALNVLASPMLFLNRQTIIERTVELKLPAIFQWPEMAEDGGLLGYGPSFIDVFRQRASMVAKIFRGAKPGDLPVEQPSTFKLAVNLKTAKAMNYNIPASLLLRADKIIE